MAEGWMTAAGRLIDAVGTREFGKCLAAALRTVAPYDFTVVFGYAGTARPLDLYDDFPPGRRLLHVEEYQAGPYLLDPFFLVTNDDTRPGLWRIRDIAPDRFHQGEYWRSYYAQTGLAEEIGYLIEVAPGLKLIVSLMRREKRFSNAEVRALAAIWPVIEAACRKNWQNAAPRTGDAHLGIAERIEHTFQRIGEGTLTPRERQVVELTLRGHSAEAIGTMLDISPGTVRIHRRNIYAKLRISSQGELFSIFINAMLGNAGTPDAPRATAAQ